MRDEKNRKLEEHKQRVLAMEQADYKIYDETRAKSADALYWLDFETKVREYINKLIMPVLQLSCEDRE